MRDHHMGGLLAFLIAAPLMIICYAGGGVILAAILGGIGGWLTGLGGVVALLAAGIAMLIWRGIRRSRHINGYASPHPMVDERTR
jgi:membrane protein implicated in regulation of membrane protease activity